MASTYSTNLRLELIGAGEQAGTWGATTNNNLGTLLDQAIAGYTTVAVGSANQAFSATNGGADESRNAIIKVTTSTSADFAVYAPPVSKQYVIYNSTAYIATIYNSTVLGNTTAAGTGVAIPAATSLTVWSDGTNFSATGVLSTEPVGAIKMWAGSVGSPPTGYLSCNGSAVSRATYAALFAVIGTTFGTGDGSTTFNLPNYQDRFPIGAGNSYSTGGTGGSASTNSVVAHTHTASFTGSAMTAHSHSVSDPGHTHTYNYHVTQNRVSLNDINAPIGNATSNNTGSSTTGISVASASAGTPSGSVSVDSTGSSSISILNPYIGIGFIIKT